LACDIQQCAAQVIHDSVEEEEQAEEQDNDISGTSGTSGTVAYELEQHYFIADLLLPRANAHMDGLAQRLLDAPLLSAILQGGAFSHVSMADGVELPHGVADWTVTHHMWNTTSPSRQQQQREDQLSYFPIYFHCESHRAGAVNWRMDDARTSASGA